MRFAGIVFLVGFALLAGARAGPRRGGLAHFAEARAAFEAEDFSKARALFERALAAGMEGPAIHYNIGPPPTSVEICRAPNARSAKSRARRRWLRWPTTTSVSLHWNAAMSAKHATGSSAPSRSLRMSVWRTLASQRLAELPEPRAPGSLVLLLARRRRLRRQHLAPLELRSRAPATGSEDSYGELIFAGSYSFGRWRVDTAAGNARVHEPG